MSDETTVVTERDLLDAFTDFDVAQQDAWGAFVRYKLGTASEREVHDANHVEQRRRDEMRDLLKRAAGQIGDTR